jgi:prepilin-type N-terminal cleavage/methylation domain-containing protein
MCGSTMKHSGGIVKQAQKLSNSCSLSARRPPFSARLRNRQGFTLLELIIVCLLITISLAFSVPALRQTLVVDQLAASSRKVIALIREVRMLATQEQQPYLIHFDLDKKKIWYRADVATPTEEQQRPDSQPGIQFPPSVYFKDIQSGTTEKKLSGELALWINRQGYMEQTILHLADDQDNIISLVISPFLSTIKANDSYISLD